MIILKSGYTNKEYADCAVEANQTGKIMTILENGDVDLTTPPEPSLDELKEIMVANMKKKRDVLEQSGFTYLDKVFDSDTVSIQRISIACLNALEALRTNNTAFSIEWTCKDNSNIALSAEQLVGLSAALAYHSGTLHEKYRQIKEAINSKETAEEVYTINWDTFVFSIV